MDRFTMMWTIKGQPLRSLVDLMNYIYTRHTSSQHSASGHTTPQVMNSNDISQEHHQPAARSDPQPLLIIVSVARPGRHKASNISISQNPFHELSSSNDDSISK